MPQLPKRILLSLACWGATLWLSGQSVAEPSFDFAYDISPILAKAGCSAAECHGGATGQGGFKLSLFAENPNLDYEAIALELDGRRIDFREPGKSLFLRKPSRDGVKHKGGRILHATDGFYQTLTAWIEEGAPMQSGPPIELVDLKIQRQDNFCRVTAAFDSEGKRTTRDVTSLALLESTNEQVATIDEEGRISVEGPGETWLLARYGKLSARIAFVNAFTGRERAVSSAASNALDRIWLERLAELGLEPSPPAAPYTLARRLYLDLAGRPPDPLELEEFIALSPSERVGKTSKILVESPGFVNVFGRAVAEFFEIPVAGRDPRNAEQRNTRLRQFFREAVRRKDPLPAIAEAVLSSPVGQLAWKHYSDPRDRSEYIGRTMLGMRIGCARCHNHPLDRWTNDEHLSFSAFFTDPRPGPQGEMMAGKFFLPGSGASVTPQLLPVSTREVPAELAREELVRWLVLDGAESQFARNFGNRLFSLLMGRSLVSLTDDHRLTNPAIHVPLMDLVAEKVIEFKGDLRRIVEFLVDTKLYASSSLPPDWENTSGDPELKYLARREARTMSPDQLKEAVEFVLGVPIEAEAPPESPLARQLYLLNSGMLQRALATPGNQVEAMLLFESDPDSLLESLYRQILSRPPRDPERNQFLPMLEKTENLEKAIHDLAFALLASREFGSVR